MPVVVKFTVSPSMVPATSMSSVVFRPSTVSAHVVVNGPSSLPMSSQSALETVTSRPWAANVGLDLGGQLLLEGFGGVVAARAEQQGDASDGEDPRTTTTPTTARAIQRPFRELVAGVGSPPT